MAPRKRISRIPTRLVVAPEVVVTDGSGRSIGTQTDPEPNPVYAPQPTKRQKIREKIKQLSKANKPDEPSCSSAGTSSSLPVRKWGNHYPNSFLPRPNEKACQVKESELGAVTRPKSDFAYKMQALKTEVDRRRVESIIGDIHRLNALDEMINRDPPPRWAAASDMWLEVDRLEARVEAFTTAAKKRKSDANQKKIPQSDANQKKIPQSDASKKKIPQSDANKKKIPKSDANKKKIPQSGKKHM